MDAWEVRIENSDAVEPLLRERGLNEAEIMVAIAHGETTGRRFARQSNQAHSLVRLRYGVINVYAEYMRRAGAFTLLTAYSHRTELASDGTDSAQAGATGEHSDWLCVRCDLPVSTVADIAVTHKGTEVGSLAGLRCPGCGLELLLESVVVDELVPAEEMLFSK